MLRPFKVLTIGSEFTYNGKVYVKTEKVYKESNCCVPEYNAYAKDNPTDKILMASSKSVEVQE
jgi:hypothetical protein